MLARPLSAFLLAALLGALGAPSVGHAQDPDGPPHVEPPPAPEEADPSLLIGVRIGGMVPLERADICPGDSLCVLGGGGAFGLEIERRWPFGLGILVAYDAWFVDSGGVFELGVVQIVRAAVRYAIGYDQLLRPFVEIGAGALVFGDTFLVETVGGALEIGLGAELELSEAVAITATAEGWVFTTTPFTTGRDRTLRSPGLGINAALTLSVGLLVTLDP